MATLFSGQVRGPGGAVGWQLRGPALLAQAGAFRAALQTAYRNVAQATGQRLKAQAAAAYPYESISKAFGYRTQASPYVSVTLFNTSPIFPFVEYNTRPHEITAKNGPYLWFKGKRGWAKVHSVNHPGTKGKYLVAKLFQDAEQGFQAALIAASREVLTRA